MPGDTPMPFDAAPFDPIKHPLREEALRWWDAGYARQATLAYGKRPPSPFADFFRGFVAGRDTLRRPAAESVDAALSARVARLEAALRFYADRDNWIYGEDMDGQTFAVEDCGEKARAALEDKP